MRKEDRNIHTPFEQKLWFENPSLVLKSLQHGQALCRALEKGDASTTRDDVRLWLLSHAYIIGQGKMAEFRLHLFNELDELEVVTIIERLQRLIETSFQIMIKLTSADERLVTEWENLGKWLDFLRGN